VVLCTLSYFTTYDFTTFTTLRLLIDLETHFCTINSVSRSIKSRESREVVSREVVEVVMWSFTLCHSVEYREWRAPAPVL
jgi:hypothetical protein